MNNYGIQKYVKIPTESVATLEESLFQFRESLATVGSWIIEIPTPRRRRLTCRNGCMVVAAIKAQSRTGHDRWSPSLTLRMNHLALSFMNERQFSKINDRALLYMHIYTHYLYYKYLNSLSIKIFLSSKSSCMITRRSFRGAHEFGCWASTINFYNYYQ